MVYFMIYGHMEAMEVYGWNSQGQSGTAVGSRSSTFKKMIQLQAAKVHEAVEQKNNVHPLEDVPTCSNNRYGLEAKPETSSASGSGSMSPNYSGNKTALKSLEVITSGP